ncbi:helix-turn-helix protein [Motilibacter rhizosphaerae]|uniref:Helix-turn-helix protein n=1 Tax=Motilibacter rhizosphaerae TaxID=598652 RepID=A0A4Q7NFP5_9ACTN|nr:helix-turn-helix transcriptional regulator [Motilibacter rhizosphaerae]RZS82711.1 helix-turn-helix protein [Motilibacter rhizosphaerae]
MDGRSGPLGELLRSRRQAADPRAAGLPASGRRRTPGLRREEVAALADVSVSYYTYLEQGRQQRPSAQVVDALARVLHLTPAERAYAHELARGTPETPVHEEVLAPGLQELVDRLYPDPAYVKGRWWDVLAANAAARVLFTDWCARPPSERNLLRWMFLDPEAKQVYVDWEREATAMLGRFRASAGAADDPRTRQLVADLLQGSATAARAWDEVRVAPIGGGQKLLRHSHIGEVPVTHVVLHAAEDLHQKLVVFTCSPEQRRRLAELAEGLG